MTTNDHGFSHQTKATITETERKPLLQAQNDRQQHVGESCNCCSTEEEGCSRGAEQKLKDLHFKMMATIQKIVFSFTNKDLHRISKNSM